MRKLRVKRDIECMNCLACVLECSSLYFGDSDPDKAALRIDIKSKKEPDLTKPVICVQCGNCAEACPRHAITQNKLGVYIVNKKICDGCGECVEACPFGVMRMPEGLPAAFKCITCGKCAAACPMELMEVVNN